MNTEIPYSGHAVIPSDYECPDGQLDISLNLIHEDGHLKPVPQPDSRFFIGENRRLFIHMTTAYKNYISYVPESNIIVWIGSEENGKFDSEHPLDLPDGIGAILDITSIGNIIILSTTLNVYYIRYNTQLCEYIFLGSKIPDITLELALKLNFTLSEVSEESLEIEIKPSEESDKTTTGDNDWTLANQISYNVSESDGTLSHEKVPVSYEELPDNYISTGFVPFDPVFKIKANVDYKIKWECVGGCYMPMTMSIWGKRNDSTKLEQLFWLANGKPVSNTIEATKSFTYEYTDICYVINLPDTKGSQNTRGNINFYKGLDDSEAGIDDVTTYIKYTEESYNSLMGAINKYISQKVTDTSRFIYPFFARYAVKMYDNSYNFISEPILMIPNSGYVPAVNFSKTPTSDSRLILSAFAADIRYRVQQAIPENWLDLISGVDIFVSSPIWPYNQGQEYDEAKNQFHFTQSVVSFGVGVPYLDDTMTDGDIYKKIELIDYINRFASNVIKNNYIQVAGRPIEDIREDLESVTAFYKIASIDITDLNSKVGSFFNLDIREGLLSSLVAQESLDENVLQYDGFKNAYLKVYNNRLHICHASVVLRQPSHPKYCFNYLTDDEEFKIITRVYIKTENGNREVINDVKGGSCGPWFFYPDARAFKARFILKDYADHTIGQFEVDLKNHSFLNGSYWYAGELDDSLLFQDNMDTILGDNESNSIEALSSIYVSEANNPFTFRPSSVVSVGADEVKAIASASKALSQGQFGQFPLYAFTSEGVWALEVGSTGAYVARQPITRDVCVNPAAITQIDSAVLFPTSRGIMMLSGADAQCITDSINTDTHFDILSLPAISQISDLMQYPTVRSALSPLKPFSEFLAGCGMIYDYPGQRIIIYNRDCDYAYIYSLRSHQWGMMDSDISYSVNSYPEALAVDRHGELVDFSRKLEIQPSQLLITRPLKLDAPDVLKTVDTVIQRGMFPRGSVRSVLYGSRDLSRWHLISSSTGHTLRGFSGTPYKYFRIALISDLSGGEYISRASVSFRPRLTDKLR